jgi:TatD DNase family protein
MGGWVDSHCHVPFGEGRFELAEAALEPARAAGVVAFVTVGTDRAQSLAGLDVAARHADVWATVGLHPHDAVQGTETVRDLLDAARVVAVGECGLDLHYEHSPREVQLAAFAEQVAWANERDLALVVHTREAWDETIGVLTDVGVPARTVIHCFSGGPDEARRCLDLGCSLSFSGIVTFPKAPELREAAALCPPDRLLVETDSPYLAPVPHRGRPNSPALVPVVGAAVAAARGEAGEAVRDLTAANAVARFRLPAVP